MQHWRRHTCHYSLSLLEPIATLNVLHCRSITISVDFHHASYQMKALRCIPSSGPYSSSMVSHDHRLEAEFCIVIHVIYCKCVFQRVHESFCCVNDVYTYYRHPVTPLQQNNPDHNRLANLPQYEVSCCQSAMSPQQ